MKNIVEKIILSRYNAISCSYTEHSKIFHTLTEAFEIVFNRNSEYKYINHIITTQLSKEYDSYHEQVLIVILEKYE